MAAAREVKVGPFTGIDNLNPEDALRPGAARELVNVDLNAAGQAQRRGGFVNRIAASYAHSLVHAASLGQCLAVLDGTLSRFDRSFAPVAVRAGLPELRLSYAELNGDLYWTNQREFRRIRGDSFADTEGWIDCTAQAAVSATAGGGWLGGTYQVAQTFVDGSGRESGAVDAVVVQVPEGGGITVAPAGVPPEAVAARFYVSPRNGDVLYHARDVALPAAGPVPLSPANNKRKPLETFGLIPLQPGHLLSAYGARLYMAIEDCVYWGEAFRYGLGQPDSGWRFGARVSLLQPCGERAVHGQFVAAGKRTFFVSGEPEQATRDLVYPHGVVEGSGRTVPGSLFKLDYAGPVAFWLASNGVFCVGLPTGQVLPLTEGQVALPQGAEWAAALVRERGGLRQILMALQGQLTTNSAAHMGDAAVVTVRRNGLPVS